MSFLFVGLVQVRGGVIWRLQIFRKLGFQKIGFRQDRVFFQFSFICAVCCIVYQQSRRVRGVLRLRKFQVVFFGFVWIGLWVLWQCFEVEGKRGCYCIYFRRVFFQRQAVSFFFRGGGLRRGGIQYRVVFGDVLRFLLRF